MSGLTCAVALLEAGTGVVVLTAGTPSGTVSAVAGAMLGAVFGSGDERSLDWERRCDAVFRQLAGDPATGVRLLAAPEPGPGLPPWVAEVPGYRDVLTGSRLPPGFTSGFAAELPFAVGSAVTMTGSTRRSVMTEPEPTKPPATRSEDPAIPAGAPPVRSGMFLLELVPVPVSDVDRAKAFYSERLGFHVDVDVRPADGVRIVQLTPPGSACSITLVTGIPWLDMPAGSLRGLHLVVSDIEEARAALIDRGAEVGPVQDLGGVFYASFADPDGNTWTLQHMPWRA